MEKKITMGLANNKTSQYISDLIGTGADAMKNLYYLEFSGNLLTDISESLKVRVQDFKPPTATQGTQTINFMTVSMDVPSASITIDKTLSFTFRLDENYKLYKYLLQQQSTTMNGNQGFATNRVPENNDNSNGLTIRAYVYDRMMGEDIDNESNYRKMYEFRYCWITSISGLQYSYDNANAETLSVTVKFLDFDCPEDNIAGRTDTPNEQIEQIS